MVRHMGCTGTRNPATEMIITIELFYHFRCEDAILWLAAYFQHCETSLGGALVGGCVCTVGFSRVVSLRSLANLFCLILFDVLLGCWQLRHQQLVVSSSSSSAAWAADDVVVNIPITWWCGVSDCVTVLSLFSIFVSCLDRVCILPHSSSRVPYFTSLIFFYDGLFGESISSKEQNWPTQSTTYTYDT